MLESSNACHLTIFRSVEKHYPWLSTVYFLPYHAKAKTTVLHCTDYEVWLLNQFFTEIMQHLLYMYIDKYENVPYHPGITHMCYEWKKTREQNTCKKKLNRKMLERLNICYIFGKLGDQGCQIWHSHVSMPFNSAPAHSTCPHNAKKSSLRYHFSRNSWKLGSQKLLPHGHFWWGSKFFSFSLPSGPRGMFEPNSDK